MTTWADVKESLDKCEKSLAYMTAAYNALNGKNSDFMGQFDKMFGGKK